MKTFDFRCPRLLSFTVLDKIFRGRVLQTDMLKDIFMVIQFISALVLIGLMAVQTTKTEGLGGTIGGKTESSFGNKLGFEEKIEEITKWAAIAFLVVSFIVAYFVS